MEKIDFVILWVDDSDREWLKEKNQYSPKKADYSSDVNRFRSFDNLQYWFRAVEKFAPWVNNIYFITWGHLPAWLNTDHPKLKIVTHKDYIPEEYLPTFNSNTIELNLCKIPELSERFVLFNDDTFLIDEVSAEDFFVGDKIRDEMVESVIGARGKRYRITHTIVNNMCIINEYFSKRKFIRKNLFKLINPKYGRHLKRSLLLLPYPFFTGFRNPHLPQPHLKSTFEKLWDLEYGNMHNTCLNKFRGYNDLNHWLMRYWNLCSGNFVPRKSNFGKSFNVSKDNTNIVSYITEQKGKMVCVNDVICVGDPNGVIDFESVKLEINHALEHILPEKSEYEL